MADSRALEIAVAAYQACHFIGMPECSVHLTHAVVYLSLATQIKRAICRLRNSQKGRAQHVIRTSPAGHPQRTDALDERTGLRGKGYQYAHDTVDKLTDMQCLPDSLEGT